VQLGVYRRGDFSQAALHVSDSASCQQGPFAPRELPRFPATTTPSDFRPCSTSWLWIPNCAFWSIPQHAGSPRFLDSSLGTRCPLPPRRAQRVHMPVASPLMLASPSLKGWPLSTLRFEAEPGSLSLRLAPCALQGFRARLPAFPACSATCVTGISHGELLQFTREARLGLAHQSRRGEQRGAERLRARIRLFSAPLCFSLRLRVRLCLCMHK
jgi:hypothetical protein